MAYSVRQGQEKRERLALGQHARGVPFSRRILEEHRTPRADPPYRAITDLHLDICAEDDELAARWTPPTR